MGEKDLFYDLLANPQLTLGDLEAVGHSTQNTRLFSRDYYKNNEKVREKFTDQNGTFNEKAFNQEYSLAAAYYKGMTDDSYNKNLIEYTKFDKDNILVDPKLRTLNDAPQIVISSNPTRNTTSLIEVGKTTSSGKSAEEVAQAEKTLLNPVEVENGADPIWGESPNDEWWKDPFSTRVLAKYDTDGYHIDPLTGKKEWHKKDDLKLNENGTYYYEDLDGRSVYGRQVLNKFNTLTTDGSWWNQYDFFDSDDLNQKSIAGSVAKNLFLVGSMFLPYVGWGIAAASVGAQLAGLVGTFGKMLVGSDSPTLSSLEGFSQSWNRQTLKSQYARENVLCWENFIDLIGDTTAQLREQRAIFKFAPAILKGKYGAMGKEGLDTLKENKTKQLLSEAYSNKKWEDVVQDMYKAGKPQEYIEKMLTSGTDYNMMSRIAAKQVEDYFNEYNKIGEKIARAYMVGITVGDTYGEAKAAGATDSEAAFLTAGYAAMENALLSTELGRWIFPELKGQKVKYKAIAEAFAGIPKETRAISNSLARASKETKKDWMKRMFNAGKEAAKKDYSLLNKTSKAVLANGLGEGLEEVSEELLADFSKACFNAYRTLAGEDAILDTWGNNWDWEDAAARYGMSFFGGIIGGGINGAATDFTQIRDYSKMNQNQAMQELTWMARNGELEDFWKTVSKMELGRTNIGTKQHEDGTWEIGTKTDNQDLEIKKVLKNTLDSIQSIVNAEGANLDDHSFIANLLNANPNLANYDLLKDLRTEAIANSSAAGKLVKNYNSLIKDIVDTQLKINEIKNNKSSDSAKLTDEQLEQIDSYTQKLTELRKKKDDIVNGNYTFDLYRRSLFEATYALSEGFTTATEEQYVKRYADKSIQELTPEEKENWHRKYIEFCKSEKAETMEFFADHYYDLAQQVSKGLTDSLDFYQKLKDGQLPKIQALQSLTSKALPDIMQIIKNGGEASDIQDYIQKLTFNSSTNSSPELLTDIMLEIQKDQLKKTEEELKEDQEDGKKLSQLLASLRGISDPSARANLVQQFTDSIKNPLYKELADLLINKVSNVQKITGSIDEFGERISNILEQFPEDATRTMSDEDIITRSNLLLEAFYDTIAQELLNSVDEAKSVGFIHPEVKETLEQSLNDLNGVTGKLRGGYYVGDLMFSGYMEEWQGKINSYLNDLKELPSAPLQKILDTFTTSLKTNKTVTDLLNDAIGKQRSHANDVENISMTDPEIYDYEQALLILKLMRQAVVGARVDGADLENLYGYNKTLNDLAKGTKGYTELATIDAADASYALQDINMAINRLETTKAIHELNKGNKMNAQNHASVNKNLIMYNKLNKLIVSILNDDDKADIRTEWNVQELADVLDRLETHKQAWGDPMKDPERNVSERILSLNPQQRKALDKEAIMLGDAIYNFFQKNLGNVKDPKKLARLLSQFDYIQKNDGILNKNSETIDDNSFTWWLASKAALKYSDFVAVFDKIMDGADVENPIAPLPTQELGVYAAIASIYNGKMFEHFADAIRTGIYDKWKLLSEAERKNILNKNKYISYGSDGKARYGMQTKFEEKEDWEDDKYDSIYDSDVMPKYPNILFIEGIAGGGKSTLLKLITKILFDQNPEVDSSGNKLNKTPIFVAHGTKKNAENLIKSFDAPDGWTFNAFDKTSLLSHFSDDYKSTWDDTDKEYKYYLRTKDNQYSNIVYNQRTKRYEATWRIKEFADKTKIPKVIFIDEWSHYTQPEIDFLYRVARKYGIQIIACGDLEQITPRALLYKVGKNTGDKKYEVVGDITIDRNLFPRVPKLGISMRTGNGQKSENQARIRAWKLNKKLPIELTHIEVNGQLYGDKVYNSDEEVSDAILDSVRKDIQKMVDSLNPGEKIGYFHSWGPGKEKSRIYKMIESEFKQYFDTFHEKDAQGKEARYYIIENDRTLYHMEKGSNGKDERVANNPEIYQEALYTGMTRAQQASIIIAPTNRMGNTEMGTILVKNAADQPNQLIPDNYTGAGIRKYTKARKESLAKAWNSYATETGNPNTDINSVKLTYIPREGQPIDVVVPAGNRVTKALAKTDEPINNDKPDNAPPADGGTPPKGPEPSQNDSENPDTEPPQSDTPEDNDPNNEPPTPPPPTETIIDARERGDNELEITDYKVLPRGTELTSLYDLAGRPDEQFIGAVLGYNSDTGMYQITQDGENRIEIPFDTIHEKKDIQVAPGVIERQYMFKADDPEWCKKNGKIKLLELDEHSVYEGKYPIGTEIYSTGGDLVGTIKQFKDGQYLIEGPNGSTTFPENEINNRTKYMPGKTTVAKYAVGDTISKNHDIVVIVGVNKLNSGGYSYTINRIVYGVQAGFNETWQEKDIDDLISQNGGKLRQKTPTTTDAAVEPDTTFDDLNGKDRQDALEEILKDEDSPEEEVVDAKQTSQIETPDNKTKTVPDLNFSVFGYSFNTFYSGINYDKDTGEVVVTSSDVDRVDAGMGLYNIDPTLCENEEKVVKIIGNLRSAAMYCNNTALMNIIKQSIPKLKDEELEIRWAFVSKSEKPSTNKNYYRFTPAEGNGSVLRNAPIDNHDQKSQMQYKTISMIIRKRGANKNDKGVTLLEIPLLTLSSPQTILCKIGKQNADNPVYKVFIRACQLNKYNKQQFNAMKAVIKYIDDNEKNLGNGYKKLRALCNMWLFTNNGVKFIGDNTFNLAESARNLGVKFIGSRIADGDLVNSNSTLEKLDFTGMWRSLRSEANSRPEVVYSSVMIATNQDYNGTSIAPAGHPFVLRLDAPPALFNVPRESITDEILMEQFIKQEDSKKPENKPIPEWVKLIPVTPPETSVKNYLSLMIDSSKNPYGNGFTSFRILSALYLSQDPDVKALWNNYLRNFSVNGNNKKAVEDALTQLIQIQKTTTQNKGESHSTYLSRVVRAQKDLMTKNLGWQSMFNAALISLTHPNTINDPDTINNKPWDEHGMYIPNAELIQKTCNKAGITGVLRSKKIQPGSDAVAGYAYKLEVSSQDQYKSPEGEDWRIFEKYDSPSFDLTSILLGKNSDLNESLLVQWSNDATTFQTENALIWKFKYENQKGKPTDLSLYLAREGNTEQVPPVQTWRTNHANLLEQVGLKDNLEFGTDAQSEAEFLQKVVDYWVSKTDQNGRGLGNIGAVFNGEAAFCGNMDDSKVQDQKLPEFYKHLRQQGITKVDDEPNIYLITMVDDSLENPTTYLIRVGILPDEKKYQVYFMQKVSKDTKTPLITLEVVKGLVQNISNYLKTITNPTEKLQERAKKLSNLLDSIKDKNLSESEAADEIIKAFGENKFTLSTIAKMLGKKVTYFSDLNKLKQSEESTEENKEEYNWCPIGGGYKNFM